jgi:hypothetical protein
VLEGLLLNGEQNSVPNNALPGCVYHAALLVANSVKAQTENTPLQTSSLDCQRRHSDHVETPSHVAKKRRTEDTTCPTGVEQQQTPLPRQDILRKIVKTYFSTIHPWLPCVHQPNFEKRLEKFPLDNKLLVLVHAMICVTLRHMNIQETDMKEAERGLQIRVSRDAIVNMTMFDMSIESLQALILLASDRVRIFLYLF